LAFRGYLLFRATLVALTFFALTSSTSLFAPAAHAVNGGGDTLYVNQYSPNASSTPGCEDPDFTEIGSDFPTPTGAVGAASSDDTIFICGSPDADSDPYTPGEGAAGVLVGSKDLTFEGDGPELSIVDGQNGRTPFYAFGAGAYLNFDSLTVRNGSGAVDGAGVDAVGRDVNVENVNFIDNTALSGDGGAILAGQVIVNGSTFRGNSAPAGVAGAIAAVGNITAQSSDFVENSAKTWGGALSAGAGVAITDSTFTDNAVFSDNAVPDSGFGGAVYAQYVPSTIEGSTFTDNSANFENPERESFGGAVRIFAAPLSVANSTFTGNEAVADPAISGSDDVTLVSVTSSGNVGFSQIRSGGTLEIGNSIIDEAGEACVAPDPEPDGPPTKVNLGGNVISNTTDADCNVFAPDGDPDNKVEPSTIELQPLADNGGSTETMALGLGSVARTSAGVNLLGADPKDQRGLERPETEQSSGAYQLTTRQLTLTKAGGGTGTVTSSPTGIECGPNCSDQSAQFAQNPPFTTVTLTATPAPGSLFTGWSDACSGNAPTCQVGLTQAREVTAEFVVEPPPIPPLPPFGPKLKVSFSSPSKVTAGNRFSTRVTVANRAKSSNGSARVNGNSPTSATGLTSCLRLPPTVVAVRAKGAKATGGRLCWSRAKLAAGKKVSYPARLRLTRSAGASRKARSATLRASVTASNTTGETFEASGEKTFRITPAKPRKPKPVTG